VRYFRAADANRAKVRNALSRIRYEDRADAICSRVNRHRQNLTIVDWSRTSKCWPSSRNCR
jgi:hypothetical protein